MNRREFIKRFVVSTALVVTSVAGFAEIISLSSRQSQQQPVSLIQPGTSTQATTSAATTQQQSGTASGPAGYVLVASLSALGSKSSAYFNHPQYGTSLLINLNGQWKAFSATCTHRPCTVQPQGSSTIYCPCHGGTFSTSNGGVTGGPPPSPLPEFGVQILNSNLYVSTARIN